MASSSSGTRQLSIAFEAFSAAHARAQDAPLWDARALEALNKLRSWP